MLRVIWGCAWKDIRSALTERSTLIQSVTLPVNYLIMMSLFVLAGSHAPTAVVMNDHGRYARQFVSAMRQAGSFRLEVTSASAARQQLHAGNLVAIVTIPAGFERAVARHERMAIPVEVNNLDEDLTDDAHRAMRLVVTKFYAHTDPRLVSIVASERDAYVHDTGYIPFLAMSIIVIALMVSGLLQAGNAASRDWENSTIKELLLAPARTWQVLAGWSPTTKTTTPSTTTAAGTATRNAPSIRPARTCHVLAGARSSSLIVAFSQSREAAFPACSRPLTISAITMMLIARKGM